MMKLYVATSNPGKLRDFAAATTQLVLLERLPRLKEIPAPPEEAPDFEGNARAKAIYYSRFAPGAVVIADDSGLEVDALNGEPGVRSARYAEDQGFTGPPSASQDERNNLCLLAALENYSEGNRKARYRCVLAAAKDGEVLCTGSGSIEGEILKVPRGASGFGYDPLFYLPERGRTMAELDVETKLGLSHRGRAFQALMEPLARHLR